jgi:hypothetical protein
MFATISLAGAGIWTGIAFFVGQEDYFLGTVCCGWFGWAGIVGALSTFGWQLHVDVDGLHSRFLFGIVQYSEKWDALRSWKIAKTIDAETKGVSWQVEFNFGARWPTQIHESSLSTPDFHRFLDDIRTHVASLEDAASEQWPRPLKMRM